MSFKCLNTVQSCIECCVSNAELQWPRTQLLLAPVSKAQNQHVQAAAEADGDAEGDFGGMKLKHRAQPSRQLEPEERSQVGLLAHCVLRCFRP